MLSRLEWSAATNSDVDVIGDEWNDEIQKVIDSSIGL